MIAPFWLCRPIFKAIKQAAIATRPIRRYRRIRRVSKAAGLASVKTAARKAVIWKCVIVGGIGAAGTAAIVPPLFVMPAATPSIVESTSGPGQFAFLMPGEFFTLPSEYETNYAVPSGTLEFAPVPDCCSPGMPQPGPETPPETPKPVNEPASLALLATAVVLLRVLI